ncbi:Protein transport protein Sec24A [Thelohanellus kitauei]|uniref:Protein transport protein Sec24A n=1 Tax=Thelohanellus kitauei TaxID=669202 RepID=A0A0C2IXS8_THEKT|nr:Protein transport protein Sec24A [Thelohanellus kitauei]
MFDTSYRIDKRVQKIFALKSWPLDFLTSCSFSDQYFLQNYKCFSIPPTCESLLNDKIYVLDTGFEIRILFTSRVPDEMVNMIMGVESLQIMPDFIITLPKLESNVNAFLHQFIDFVTQGRPFKPTIIILKDSCAENRERFCRFLVFDNTNKIGSFRDYIKLVRSNLLDVS